MSIDSIGARIAAIESQISAMTGPPAAAAPGFDQALAGATGTKGPTATAAAAGPSAAAPVSGTLGGGAPSQFDGEIQAAAGRHGIDPALLKALIRQESNFNPAARSPAGASGLTQLMPGTASSLGVTDPTDPAQAIEGGAKYLKQQLDRFGGDPAKALAAYNAGPGAVQKYGGVPPYAETQSYVKKVLGYAEEYRGAMGAAAAPAATAAGAVNPTFAAAPVTPAAVAAALAPATNAAALTSPLASAPVASSPNQFGIV